jgi:hypothetical protein
LHHRYAFHPCVIIAFIIFKPVQPQRASIGQMHANCDRSRGLRHTWMNPRTSNNDYDIATIRNETIFSLVFQLKIYTHTHKHSDRFLITSCYENNE